MKYKPTKLNEFTKAFANSLSTKLFGSDVLFTDYEHLFSKIRVYEQSRGGLDTIKRLKEIRVSIYNHIAGRMISSDSCALYKSGLPKALGPKVSSKIAEGNLDYIRATLTVLLYSRMIDEWKEPDISTIVEGPKYSSQIREEYKLRLDAVVDILVNKPLIKPEWDNPHFTTKNSPQGNAMLSLRNELSVVTKDEKMFSSIKTIGGPSLSRYMELFSKSPEYITIHQEPKEEKISRLRSIGVVKDTEGKSRVIAMADYWSQTCLKPLHTQLLGVLKGIRSDVTFGQDIAPFGRSGELYWSFDLTAATDRLPIFLYEDILSKLYGKEFQEAWSHLMIGKEFHWKSGHVKYMTGQPMGLYSSWALLALAHHAIVQFSALKIGFKQFWDYRILGDDIVIRNDLVAHSYAETLKALGVGISSQKTLVSKDTFEFAKRLFTKGQEVTGFPLNGWISTKDKWIDQANIVETAIRRGYAESQLVNMDNLVEMMRFTGKNYNLRYKLSRNIMTQMTVTGTNNELLARVGRYWGHELSCVTSTGTFRSYINSEYARLANVALIKTMEETCKIIRKCLPDDKEIQATSNVRAMSWLVPDRVRVKSNILHEPYVQSVCSVLHSSIQHFNDIEDRYSNMGVFTTLEQFINYIKEIDLRVPSIQVRDPSRRSERAYSVTASLSVRSVMGSRERPTR